MCARALVWGSGAPGTRSRVDDGRGERLSRAQRKAVRVRLRGNRCVVRKRRLGRLGDSAGAGRQALRRSSSWKGESKRDRVTAGTDRAEAYRPLLYV